MRAARLQSPPTTTRRTLMQASAIAQELLAARARAKQIPPVSESVADFGIDTAYDVAAEVLKRRRAAGEHVVGRKIGFTNSNIWDEYGVHAPIWGYVYDATLRMARDDHGVQSLKGA